MNIFALDEDPILAAKYHCNKHVCKMIVESAQLLCNALPTDRNRYKRTHYNHPCSVWVRTSRGNFEWACMLALALCEEYTKRYGKRHKTQNIIENCIKYTHLITVGKQTDFIFCGPKEYLDAFSDDIISAYRCYYIGEKASFAMWEPKVREPWWWPKKIM